MGLLWRAVEPLMRVSPSAVTRGRRGFSHQLMAERIHRKVTVCYVNWPRSYCHRCEQINPAASSNVSCDVTVRRASLSCSTCR